MVDRDLGKVDLDHDEIYGEIPEPATSVTEVQKSHDYNNKEITINEEAVETNFLNHPVLESPSLP